MKKRFKTARCIVACDGAYLLAVHSSFWARPNRRWGLPGGGIERREDPAAAARRELFEEFDLHVTQLAEVGAYFYKRHYHAVYATEVGERFSHYDDSELLDIGWFSLHEVRDLARRSKLHAGYELDAIEAYLANSAEKN